MAEIRGEKVSFRRKDLIPLHKMPSAQTHDPLIVHCPVPTSRWRSFMKFCVIFVLLAVAAVASGFFAIETGAIDGALNSRAQAALNSAIGPRYQATVGSTAIRFDSDFRLALEARKVDIIEVATGAHLTNAGSIRLAIDPLALASGRVSIRHLEADTINLDTALLPASEPMDLSTTRVDLLPATLEQAFQRLDEARGLIERTKTNSVRIAGINIQFPPDREGNVSTLVIDELNLSLNDEGQVALKGIMHLDGRRADLSVSSVAENGVTRALTAKIASLDLTPFLLQRMPDGAPREGLEGSVDVNLTASRDTVETRPAIKAEITHAPGKIYFDGYPQDLSGAEMRVAYDFAKNSIEILPSELRFGPTRLPLTGAVVDLDRLNKEEKRPGFGLDLLISGGHAQGEAGGEAPVVFDLRAAGRFLTADRRLEFDDMQVSSPMGQMAASLKIHFPGKVSPEISFGGQLPKMEVAAVKQLWPFWMARKPRDWVVANMFGGTVTNGSIAVFIPEGRMKGPGIPMELDANELRISFDIADTRLNLTGDIPPIRNIAGHFDLKGEHLAVNVSKASSYFPSGRSVDIDGGTFKMASTYAKPLMADLQLNLSGNADAIAEAASFKPIEGLKGTDFAPQDFSGKASVNVSARFGLIKDHQPPEPTFKAEVDLEDVKLLKAVEGRNIAKANGLLSVDSQAVRIDADAEIDGVPADIELVQPLNDRSKAEKKLVVTGTLNNEQRERLAPGLSDIINGSIDLELTRLDANRQALKVDLSRSRLSVPWLGWSKGSGVPAKATLEVSAKDGNVDIRKLELSGDGFGVGGDVSVRNGSLSSAEFSRVKLSPSDDFAVAIRRNKGGFDITASGNTADLRPVLAKLKDRDDASSSNGKDSTAARVKLKLDRVIGFNDEVIGNANGEIVVREGDLQSLDFAGVTDSGQAVVAKTGTGGRGDVITLTSSDAGSLARFANLYNNMRGGLLNIRLENEAGPNWSGNIDIRSFSLANESRLQSMVSTPGQDGRSLNSAVKKDIDVSSAKFQRAFARIVYRGGALAVENGVVRGEQIGATFQGMLRDAAGRMDMTGTFMPAYGLNRLFAELPIIGTILGNGRDRGLLGITFKVSGPFEKPQLIVNPLSIIAPGVFRQIFEFQ
ncbi:DUF3971 domain-containing protein [Rhizobium helianthi]|uniref:DUF3971 domain-containing protein n=1 Tax=Rhizobium helianthi TaxID=1132695 RepID=A0ABW4LZN1_9HYPH